MTPPLKLLHSEASLIRSKLLLLQEVSTEELVASLAPGTSAALRTKVDGIVMNGNHRIAVLLARGFDVNGLPRENYGGDEESES